MGEILVGHFKCLQLGGNEHAATGDVVSYTEKKNIKISAEVRKITIMLLQYKGGITFKLLCPSYVSYVS